MRLFAPRYADGQVIEIDGMAVRLRVSARARRISLRVDRLRREAVAVAPSRRHLADAAAFAVSRRDWLSERLEALEAAPAAALPGDTVGVFGRPWRLQPDGRRPRLSLAEGDGPRVLSGCGAGAVDPQLVARMVRREAQAVFETWARTHCAALGAPPPPILLTDTRTRWGSCAPARRDRPATIRLSWRLALAPPEVADYVVAHECAHLREANHGPRFWAVVDSLVDDVRGARIWLRNHGASLHAILPKLVG